MSARNIANEAEALIGIGSERANERQGVRTDIVELVPPSYNGNGKARDEVSARLQVLHLQQVIT